MNYYAQLSEEDEDGEGEIEQAYLGAGLGDGLKTMQSCML